jgi:hypothetical protein
VTSEEVEVFIEGVFARHRRNADRINALTSYVMDLINEPVICDTGTPGAVCSEEWLAPGIVVRRNGNGTIVQVEF